MKPLFQKNILTLNSVYVWLILVAYLFLTKSILDALLPHAFADPAQAALFGWGNLGIFSIIGLVGVFLSQKTGFPAAWTGEHPFRKAILFPILIGFGIGILMVSIDQAAGFTKLIAARHGVAQQFTDFPSMLFIFTAASIIVEVVYRLFLIPVLLWLISNLILKAKAQSIVFWILAVLSSLLEPLGQYPDLHVVPRLLTIILAAIYFGINLTQAGFFRKYGFLAAIMIRMGFYFVWHIVYIH